MELLTTHNNNGGSAPNGGSWYLESTTCDLPITLNGTQYNIGDEIIGGDNPDIDFSIGEQCEIVFNYIYGNDCPTTDTLSVTLQNGETISINQLNNYACGDETSININTTASYSGDVIINELDGSGNIISSQTTAYTPTIQVGLIGNGVEQQRFFNIETIGDCSTTSSNFAIYQAPNTFSVQCETLQVCEGETNGIDLNDYVTLPAITAGSSVNLRFRWSGESVTLSDGTVINAGDEFTTSSALTLNTATSTTNVSYTVIVEYNLQGNLICDIESNACSIEVTNSTKPALLTDKEYLCRWSDFGSVYLSPQIVANGSYTLYETDSSGNIQSIIDAGSNGSFFLGSLAEGTYYYTFTDNNAACGTASDVFTLYISPELQEPTCMEIMTCTGESVNLNDGISGGSGVTINYQITNSPITPIPLVGGNFINIGDDYLPSMGLIDTSSFNNNDTITYQVTSTHTLSDGTECQRVTQGCDVKIMTCVAPCTDYTTSFTTGANTITINHITDSSGVVANYIATWENLNTGDTFQSANGSYVTATTFDPDTPTTVPVTSGNWQITLVEVDGITINCLLANTFMIESSSCVDGGTGFLSYEGPGGITSTEFDYTINSSGVTNLFISLFSPQSIPDLLEIIYEGVVIYSTSTFINNVSVPVTFNTEDKVIVRISNTDPNVNTIWFFEMECLDCNPISPCPSLPDLSLRVLPQIDASCNLTFTFNSLIGDCGLPFQACSNTITSAITEIITSCFRNGINGSEVCIDDNITIISNTTNTLILQALPSTLTSIQSAINGLSSNQYLNLQIPQNSIVGCADDGFYNFVRIFNNYTAVISGNQLTITKTTNPYNQTCNNCEQVLYNEHQNSSFGALQNGNGGSVLSIKYDITEIQFSNNTDEFYTHLWNDDNCPRVEQQYYIRITDTSDPENNWEIWSWNGTGSQFVFNTSNWTLYMDNNNPIIGCP